MNGNPGKKFLFKNLDDLKNEFSFTYHHKLVRGLSGVIDILTALQVKAEVNKTIEMINAELKSRL